MFSLKRKLSSTTRLGIVLGSLLLILITYTSSMNYLLVSNVVQRYAVQNAMLRTQIARLAMECDGIEGLMGPDIFNPENYAYGPLPPDTRELTNSMGIFTIPGSGLADPTDY